MSNKWISSAALLCLNVLAAYAPAILWVPGLPGSASIGWKFLLSPVMFAELLVWSTSPTVAWGVLLTFLALVGLASALLHYSKTAWTALPCLIGVYSLLQGLLAAQIVNGIDAIGHS